MNAVPPPKDAFAESDLARYEWVLNGVFNSLGPIDNQTRAILRRNLFLLAGNGIEDPERLRSVLIANTRRRASARMR